MNKKLLALLLVSAMAVQIKAVGSDQEEEGPNTPSTEQQEQSNDLNNNENTEKSVDSGAGALLGHNAPKTTPENSPKVSPKHSPKHSPKTPRKNSDSPQSQEMRRRDNLESNANGDASTSPAPKTRFVTPGKDDNAVIALLKRVRNNLWTATCDDKQMLENILKDGAKNFKNFSASQKAEYYNAQDAQYGLKTTRFFKAAKLAMIAMFVKIARDVIKEDTNEDDEDEA